MERTPPPTLPLASPLEALAGTLAADSTTDDDDLVCEWGPVEGQEGVWELLCHREMRTPARRRETNAGCWYLVTYACHRMECTKIREDFLGCDPNCFGGDDCDETQREIYGEYNNAEVHGGHGMSPPESPSSCEVIETPSGRLPASASLTWSELNDGFSEGQPAQRERGGWGWIQARLTQGLERLRADWGQQALSSEYGEGIPLSSGYRCPHGNALHTRRVLHVVAYDRPCRRRQCQVDGRCVE